MHEKKHREREIERESTKEREREIMREDMTTLYAHIGSYSYR